MYENNRYGQILSMHAYALTEVQQGNVSEEAEEMAHVAYGMDKKDNWALNALVHVRERGHCYYCATMFVTMFVSFCMYISLTTTTFY